jgi:hypothetical protein
MFTKTPNTSYDIGDKCIFLNPTALTVERVWKEARYFPGISLEGLIEAKRT